MKYHIFFLAFLIAGSTSCQNKEKQAQETTTKQISPKRQAIAWPEGYKQRTDSLTILSWNVEHFVDGFDNPYISNDREDAPQKMMQDKEALLAEAIIKANADIVVLQEFEGGAYLEALAKSYFPDLGYRFFANAESNNWYMNVVMMSRVPLGVLYSYGGVHTPIIGYTNEQGEQQSQSQVNTRMWTVEVLPNENYQFLLTGLHLKAGQGERNENYRAGQINFLLEQFGRFYLHDPAMKLLICGDFNAVPESKEFQLFTNNGFIDPLAGTNVLSHPADAPERRLDYIIYNQHMFQDVRPNSTEVVYLLDKTTSKKLSDHLPVMSIVELN